MAYVNPDAAPDYAINKAAENRKIKVRFASKEKFDAFVIQTGLSIDKKTKHLKFPQGPGLTKLFDL